MRYLMGTFFTIEVIEQDENKAERSIELAFAEIKRIENLFSRYKETSEIFHLNQDARNRPVPVSKEVYELIELSLAFSHLTSGLFDITTCSLTELWQQAEIRGRVPDAEELQNFIQSAGIQNIILNKDEGTIFFRTDSVKLDFGGVAKGYALDRVVSILQNNDIHQALVDAGGQFYVLGGFRENEFSSLGIVNPLNPESIVAVVNLKDESLATSGSYERFFTVAGNRYSHLINPKTGYPVESEVLSVSIVAKNAMEADVFSTAIFLTGLDHGMKFIEEYDGIESLIITNNVKDKGVTLSYSTGLKNRVEVINRVC